MISGTAFKRRFKMVAGAIAILTMAAAFTGSAGARSMGAWGAGAPVVNNATNAPDYTCYREFFGGVIAPNRTPQQDCLSQSWQVALPVDSASHTVSFVGKGDTSSLNFPCCVAYAVDTLGNLTSTGSAICANSATLVPRTVGTINVPSSGSLFLRCSGVYEDLTEVLNINW